MIFLGGVARRAIEDGRRRVLNTPGAVSTQFASSGLATSSARLEDTGLSAEEWISGASETDAPARSRPETATGTSNTRGRVPAGGVGAVGK